MMIRPDQGDQKFEIKKKKKFEIKVEQCQKSCQKVKTAVFVRKKKNCGQFGSQK